MAAVAQPEADGRDERENGEQAVGADDGRRANPGRPGGIDLQPEEVHVGPDPEERDQDEHDRDDERALAPGRLLGDERCDRDQRRAEQARAECSPRLDRAEPGLVPERTGATANAKVPMPVAKNPAASSRSIARPSTRNRVAVSTATIEAVMATDVSSAMRAFGSA